MPAFSRTSIQRLATCDPRLQRVFNEVIKTFDCTIIEGHRGKEAQEAAFAAKKSQKRWPEGNHNSFPSKAVDAAPFPIDWTDRERLSFFAGYVLATALSLGIKLRWGGDWDGDKDLKDNNFDDLVHFELVD